MHGNPRQRSAACRPIAAVRPRATSRPYRGGRAKQRAERPGAKELHDRPHASYRSGMERQNPTSNRGPLLAAKGLLEFKPWMLALAVFLACALGVAVMEQFHARSMWAQITPQDAPAAR